jgi:hypothetical protein
MPNIDDSPIGYHVDCCFEYNTFEDGGETYLFCWCDGVVVKIFNANTRMVEIEWNEQKVMKGDTKITRKKLMI